MLDPATLALIFAAGVAGGAMNALAGGGTFATLPALIAIGLPATIANATSNFALLPGAATSAWGFRRELKPIARVAIPLLAAITFVGGLLGSWLLVVTPTRTFDFIIPWLVLYAFVVLALGKKGAEWLARRVTIGRPALFGVQSLLGVYGGYFGGGVGLMMTATYGLLAGVSPRDMFAARTLMLAVANLAAAIVFVAFAMIDWQSAVPMLAGGVLGGWVGAHVGRRLSHRTVRIWTLLVTGITTIIFFARAYG